MTTVITTRIRTTDLDELLDALQMLRSWARMDERPVTCEAWSNYLEVTIGPAGRPELVDVAGVLADHVTVDPRLDPLDPLDEPALCAALSGEHADGELITCTLPDGHGGEHRNPEYYGAHGWTTAAPFDPGGDEPPANMPADIPVAASDDDVPDDGTGPDVHPEESAAAEAARQAGPSPTEDGEHECVACEARYRTRRAVSDHIRAAHWDDVISSFAEGGAKKVIADWGVNSSTGYAWAQVIRGDA